MRFDTIIIGGGLSSLVCGIRLQDRGQKCLIVSAGQNALHFSSGAFGLLGRLPDGTVVGEPLTAIGMLPEDHPYSKIGTERIEAYCKEVPGFFSSCGIDLHPAFTECDVPRNGFRITPLGTLKPAWLAMKDTELLKSREESLGKKALIVNFAGFLDFNTRFIAEGLEKRGTECRIEILKIKDVENLRKNPSEMRSVGIARVMSREENWKSVGNQVREMISGEDLVILPEVFGLDDAVITDWLKEMIPAKTFFIGTMPPSVPGIRAQMRLKKTFEKKGGMFLAGDTALGPVFEGSHVASVRTANLGSLPLEADNFVLASGNLFGKGIDVVPGTVREPVFGLDTVCPAEINDWCDKDFYAKQNYAGFGVATDKMMRALKGGEVIGNLFVAGSEVAGCNSLQEGSGAGVAIMTALYVADNILSD